MLRRVGSGGQRRAQTLGCTVYLRCRHALALSEGSAAYVFVITSARCKDCAVPDLIWEHAGQVYSATLDLGQGCVAAESPVSFYNSRTSLPSTAQLQLTQAPMTVQSEDDADQLTDVWVILAAGFFTSVFQQTWIAVLGLGICFGIFFRRRWILQDRARARFKPRMKRLRQLIAIARHVCATTHVVARQLLEVDVEGAEASCELSCQPQRLACLGAPGLSCYQPCFSTLPPTVGDGEGRRHAAKAARLRGDLLEVLLCELVAERAVLRRESGARDRNSGGKLEATPLPYVGYVGALGRPAQLTSAALSAKTKRECLAAARQTACDMFWCTCLLALLHQPMAGEHVWQLPVSTITTIWLQNKSWPWPAHQPRWACTSHQTYPWIKLMHRSCSQKQQARYPGQQDVS